MGIENAIEVKDLKKGFRIYPDKGSTIKEKLVSGKRRKYERREVLCGVSFSVKKGEAVGLIGHNGCGKSTTLKLLSRIMYPDSGQITMRGRVSSLIELGAGFHPDMSGRENIYINASIFGLTKKEIDRRLEDIIAFSELQEFIDNPVRTYSSGMYMRLAFSVAINVDADILLVDEILAVGDVNFQKKCFDRMQEIKKAGTTIVIVSHSLPQIEQICERTIWIDGGVIRDEGIPSQVHEHYLKEMESKRAEARGRKDLPSFCSPLAVRTGNKRVQFTDVRMTDGEGREKTSFRTGEPFAVRMDYQCGEDGLPAVFGIGIFRDDGVQAYGTNTQIEYDRLVPVRREGQTVVTVTGNHLLPARYRLDVAVHAEDGTPYDDIRTVVSFEITAVRRDIGLCRLDNFWTVDGVLPGKREEQN